jgi:hypothetical protein
MSNSKRVPIAQFSGSRLVAKYPSITEASLITSTQKAHIGKVANGLRKSAGGYQWKHLKNFTNRLSPRNAGIAQLSKDGSVLAVFADVATASALTGVSEARITKVVLGSGRVAGGYMWANAASL